MDALAVQRNFIKPISPVHSWYAAPKEVEAGRESETSGPSLSQSPMLPYARMLDRQIDGIELDPRVALPREPYHFGSVSDLDGGGSVAGDFAAVTFAKAASRPATALSRTPFALR